MSTPAITSKSSTTSNPNTSIMPEKDNLDSIITKTTDGIENEDETVASEHNSSTKKAAQSATKASTSIATEGVQQYGCSRGILSFYVVFLILCSDYWMLCN